MALALIKKLTKHIRSFFRPYMFGFVTGHYYLDSGQINEIKDLLDSGGGEQIVHAYEKRLASLIGDGKIISYAAGRMAFYSLLKALGIGEGDEVILPGFTCSVMVNAILRIGAIPVFVDIERETLGPDPLDIEKKITSRTRMIVAQHSFGIPCDIEKITKLGEKRGIFILEDCAISFDSSINGKKVGNWGGAAIFSSDRSKPLNTIIGGYLYTKDNDLYDKIKKAADELKPLAKDHQKRIYDRFIFERKYFNPNKYPRIKVFQIVNSIVNRIMRKHNKLTFLEDDYGRVPPITPSYPYPAKLPPFLAKIGMFELDRWSKQKQKRKDLLNRYLKAFNANGISINFPKAYMENKYDIVPLRFVFTSNKAEKILDLMSSCVDVQWIWFRSPIVCCSERLESMGYKIGSCQNAEEIGKAIINWPCVVMEGWEDKLIDDFKRIMKGALA